MKENKFLKQQFRIPVGCFGGLDFCSFVVFKPESIGFLLYFEESFDRVK